MPRLSNLPQGKNTLLGDAKLFVDIWDSVTELPTGKYFFPGDCSEATLTPDITRDEYYEHSTGTRQLLDSAPTRVKSTLEFTLHEQIAEALAIFHSGTMSEVAQAGTAVVAEVLAVPAKGQIVQTAKRNISAVTLKGGATGTTTLTLGTDYLIEDAKLGLIFIPFGSAFNPATDILKIDYTPAALVSGTTALQKVLGGLAPNKYATILIAPHNLRGPNIDARIYKAQLGGSGPAPFITESRGSYKVSCPLLFDGVHAHLYELADQGSTIT